jgi:hypothetical protein
MPDEGEFSVVEFFADDTHRYVERWLSAEDAVKLARFWTSRPASKLGWMTKVIITDGGDDTVFESQHGLADRSRLRLRACRCKRGCNRSLARAPRR